MHFPKGIRLKSFQYEMRAIFTESLVYETLFNTVIMQKSCQCEMRAIFTPILVNETSFNTVVYGAIPVHKKCKIRIN